MLRGLPGDCVLKPKWIKTVEPASGIVDHDFSYARWKERELFLEFIKELHEISFPFVLDTQGSEIVLKFIFASQASH